MFGEIENRFEVGESDEQTRIWFDIDRAPIDERGSPLEFLFRYWQEQRLITGGLPRLDTFKPEEAVPADIADCIYYVDARSDSPFNYIFANHIPSPFPTHGSDLSGKRVNDFPSLIHRRGLVAEYYFCVRNQQPRYDEIDQVLNGWIRHYRRILLPVADRGGQISRIYYAIRRVSPSRPTVESASFSAIN
ncbi:MAG: hypothetical protein QF654_06165 [Alphaproteobacteria bacterium]|jgi:hypothetical protein|nr:hypothetical protein [Alphaproteobacteria bacterium]